MPLYRDVGEGLAPAGIEYYLPLFFEKTATLVDYLPPAAVVALPADHAEGLRDAWRTLVERHEERRFDIEHPVLDPVEICVPADEWLAGATSKPHVLLGEAGTVAPSSPPVVDSMLLQPPADVPTVHFGTEPAPVARLDQRKEESIRAFAAQLEAAGERVLLAAESAGRRELLLELLRPYKAAIKVVSSWREFLEAADVHIAVAVAPIASGVTLRDPSITIYAEEQLFGERARQERRRRRSDRDPARIIQQLADLRPGARWCTKITASGATWA
jgi:transcription-repair coupling factor (superfamily II helicase)